MTERNQLTKYLRNWADNTINPHFAVLIEGPWGCGKSHFVKSLIKNNTIGKKEVIYLSTFGISDVDTLKTQLFFASASTTAKWTHQGISLFSSAIKGLARIDLNGDNKDDLNINGNFEGVEQFLQSAFGKLDQCVLILDDLERCKIPFGILLGVVNQLIEHGDTRVVLVANTNKINDQDFTDFREKIVGHSFELKSDPVNAFGAFIEEISVNRVKTAIILQRENLLNLYSRSKYHNLRALRQLIFFLTDIFMKLDKEHLENTEVLTQLTEEAFIFFTEFKLNLSPDSTQLTPRSLLKSYESQNLETRIVSQFSSGNDEKEASKKRILEKYGPQFGYQTILTIQQWVSILESGVIDKKQLNDDVGTSDLVVGTSNWPSWKRLRHFHSTNYTSENEQQFDNDLFDVNEKLQRGEYTHPEEFLQVAGILIAFSDFGLHNKTVNATINDLKQYADDQLIPKLDYKTFQKVRFDLDFGYDGLGYAGSADKEFKEIYQYVTSAVGKWHEKWKKMKLALISYII